MIFILCKFPLQWGFPCKFEINESRNFQSICNFINVQCCCSFLQLLAEVRPLVLFSSHFCHILKDFFSYFKGFFFHILKVFFTFQRFFYSISTRQSCKLEQYLTCNMANFMFCVDMLFLIQWFNYFNCSLNYHCHC